VGGASMSSQAPLNKTPSGMDIVAVSCTWSDVLMGTGSRAVFNLVLYLGMFSVVGAGSMSAVEFSFSWLGDG